MRFVSEHIAARYVLDLITHARPVDSGMAAEAVLHRDARARHARSRDRLRDAGFELTSFQKDAVEHAERILSRRGGVLIADSVGLGKTYVALALIERGVSSGLRSVVVTAPAALRSHWQRPLRRLTRALDIEFLVSRRADMLDRTEASGSPAHTRAWLAFHSHTALAIDRSGIAARAPDLVVVDESHAFRNPRTQRARALAQLCRRGNVVLISATPINNSMMDLYAQLRLFLGNGALSDLGVPDLRATFRAAHDGRIDPRLSRAIATVTVRRTRLAITTRYDAEATLRFPRRAAPVPVRYDADWLGPAVDAIDKLKLAPFQLRPFRAGARLVPAGSELLRHVLLKRLESGSAAFRRSVQRLVQFLRSFEAAAASGHLLTPRDHRTGGTDGDQLIFESLVLGTWPRALVRDAWLASVREDLARLMTLETGVAPDGDAKLERLGHLLAGPLAGSKVLLFTEFRETAAQIHHALRDRPGVARIDGGGAWIASGRATRAAVIGAFSPRSNRQSLPAARDRIDLLIATDVLSEGLDLQDASVVVSYDLPWNPVRLIQRIGRIDRLGSGHDVIHTYCFLPDASLDAMLGLLDRIHRKLDDIRRGMGTGDSLAGLANLLSARHQNANARAADPPGQTGQGRTSGTDSFMKAGARVGGRRESTEGIAAAAVTSAILSGDPDLFGAIERTHDHSGLPEVDAMAVGSDVFPARSDPPDWRFPRRNPDGQSISAPQETDEPFPDQHSVVAAVATSSSIRKAHFILCYLEPGVVRLVRKDGNGDAVAEQPEPLEVLRSFSLRSAHTNSSGSNSDRASEFDHDGFARAHAACCQVDESVNAGPEVRHIATRFMRAAANVPGGLDAPTCARVDAVLQRVRAGLRRGVELQLASMLRSVKPGGRPSTSRPVSFHALLSNFEQALADPGQAGSPQCHLVAVLEIRPPPS